MFKDDGESITIPTRAKYHLGLQLEIQQLIGPRRIEETAVLQPLHSFAIQQCFHRTARLREVSLQLSQGCIGQRKSDAMGTVNLHRTTRKRLMRNDGTSEGR